APDRTRRLEATRAPCALAVAREPRGLARPADRRALGRIAARDRLDGAPGPRLAAPEGRRPGRDRHAGARLPRPPRAWLPRFRAVRAARRRRARSRRRRLLREA